MRQVDPGPKHSAQVQELGIAGVLVMSVPTASYEYGGLSEIYNPAWDSIYLEPLEHMYVINNDMGQRNDWHVHHHTTDRYVLISGDIEVALYDSRQESETFGQLIRFPLTQVGKPGNHGLRIPAGVWHTFKSVSDGFTLLNNKTPAFNQENPDKYSVSFEESGVDFRWE